MNYDIWIASGGNPNNYWGAYGEDTTYVEDTISWIKDQYNAGKSKEQAWNKFKRDIEV